MAILRAFFAALLLMSGLAWADDGSSPVLYYGDDIGSLTLTQEACPVSVASQLGDIAPLFKKVIYTHVTQGSMDACWVVPPGSGVVMIAYADGDSSAVPQHLFTPVKPSKAESGT